MCTALLFAAPALTGGDQPHHLIRTHAAHGSRSVDRPEDHGPTAQQKFRRLNVAAFALPPCAKQLRLLSGHAIGDGEGQSAVGHILCLLQGVDAAAGAILTAMDDELDKLTANWTKTLLDNLADPTTQENLALLTAERRKQVESFVKSRRLPDRLSQSFVQALQEALSGLVRVVIKSDGLRAALLVGGTPATPSELTKRFEEFLNSSTRGKDKNKVRIVLE
jgi:hypothetical protein